MTMNNRSMVIKLEEGWALMILDYKPWMTKLEEGWACLQKDITKVKNLLEGGPKFTPDEYMSFYTAVYNMCTVKPGGRGLLQEVHDKYRGIYKEYMATTILPALSERRDESLLRELVKRWNNHKIMVRLLSHVFAVLDRGFLKERTGGTSAVGIVCFRYGVYAKMKNDVKDAIIALIAKERDGEQIDRALLKNVLEMFVEVGMVKLDAYEGDFEAAMLANTTAYYFRKAASWIEQDSFSEYALKAEECLEREKERAGHYLHANTEPKLLEVVQYELFTRNEAQLWAKQMSGCNAVLEG